MLRVILLTWAILSANVYAQSQAQDLHNMVYMYCVEMTLIAFQNIETADQYTQYYILDTAKMLLQQEQQFDPTVIKLSGKEIEQLKETLVKYDYLYKQGRSE